MQVVLVSSKNGSITEVEATGGELVGIQHRGFDVLPSDVPSPPCLALLALCESDEEASCSMGTV